MSLRRLVASILLLASVLALTGCGGEPVPDLTGTRVLFASANLQRAGFMPGEVRYDEHSPEPDGTIISQHPRPGRNATPGSPIDLTVAGPALVRMPRLVGLSYEQARAALELAGLRHGRVTPLHDARFAKDVVFVQGVPPAKLVAQDSRIDLTVSLGPETIQVPGVVGRDSMAARTFLSGLGFDVVQRLEYSPRPAGEVLAQSPEVRVAATPGSRVNLTVSRGPRMCVMPDVEGDSLEVAEERLADLGLAYTAVGTGGATIVGPDAHVVVQEPMAGKLIPVGVTVILRVDAR